MRKPKPRSVNRMSARFRSGSGVHRDKRRSKKAEQKTAEEEVSSSVYEMTSALPDYINLEQQMLEFDRLGETAAANAIRDKMELIWLNLTIAEKRRLDGRPRFPRHKRKKEVSWSDE